MRQIILNSDYQLKYYKERTKKVQELIENPPDSKYSRNQQKIMELFESMENTINEELQIVHSDSYVYLLKDKLTEEQIENMSLTEEEIDNLDSIT